MSNFVKPDPIDHSYWNGYFDGFQKAENWVWNYFKDADEQTHMQLMELFEAFWTVERGVPQSEWPTWLNRPPQ